jgi:glycosyltransferase involved in cell wall biosynthesis
MKISVAICTFNGERFLKEQIDSILNQSVLVDEIIVCDDISIDNTTSILKEYETNYPSLFKIFKNYESLGTIKNFEKAILNTTGDLIFLADQDDIWHWNKVEKILMFFNKNNKCKLLFSNGSLIDEFGNNMNGTLWDKWGFDEILRAIWKDNRIAFQELVVGNNRITGATICFSKSIKRKILPINLPFGYWHDGWIGLHAAAVNGLFFIEESLISYRVHAKQQIGISNVISHDIIFNSNKNFINRIEFYNNIAMLYPRKKKYIPLPKKKILKKVLLKMKQILATKLNFGN